MFFSFPAIHCWLADPLTFIGYLAGWGVSGIIFGLMGMAITQFMLIHVFKLPEEKEG
jgi:hypothetical protein